MTDGVIAQVTEPHDLLAIGLNGASTPELAGYRALLMGGATALDLLEASWASGGPLTPSAAMQRHVREDIYGVAANARTKGARTTRAPKVPKPKHVGWWSDNALPITTEATAQFLTRMLFDTEGKPRKWPKRLDIYWLIGYSLHYHMIIRESPELITVNLVTPPKGDHASDYARYQRELVAAEKRRPKHRSKDPDLKVASNFTRVEDLWIVSDKAWAVTHGVDRTTGKWRPVVKIEPNLTPSADVLVTRALCEDYKDPYPQGRSAAKRKKA